MKGKRRDIPVLPVSFHNPMNLLDIIYPHPCLYCGRFAATDKHGFCNECMEILKPSLKKYENTWFLFSYEEKIASLLKSSKYASRPYYIKMLAGLMGSLMKEAGVTYDMVIYVPMNRKSMGIRGYNQSRVAAKNISSHINSKLDDDVLYKAKENDRQAGLSRTERKLNVRDVYSCRKRIGKGISILLVDDIMTTGSTLDECIRVLRNFGASRVDRAVIALTSLNGNT
jgi:ComF family protein